MMRQTKACLNAAGSHLVETEKFMLCGGGERLLQAQIPERQKKKKSGRDI